MGTQSALGDGSARRSTVEGRLLTSTVAKKVAMAVTGLVLLAFLVFHVTANLLVFAGRPTLNGLAGFLDHAGLALQAARLVLLIAVVLHIWAVVALLRADRRARPVPYARQRVPQAATLASRTMRWGGLVLALFVIFHVLHLTTGTIRPAPFSETDIYADVVGGFRVGWVVVLYLVGLLALAFHLYHGTWAAFRTLGLARHGEPFRRPWGWVAAIGIAGGFTLIPLAVLSGLLR